MSDLDRLIRFAYVAEELSFSEAARRLNVDQPWLSRQVQQLEAQLDFPLFTRSTRKVELTKEGQELFSYAQQLAQAAIQCRQAARGITRSRNHELSIGVNPFTYWLPERRAIIDGFKAQHPRVSIDVSSNYTTRLLSKLRKRVIDLVLVAEPFHHADLEALVIHESPVSLLVPPEDELASARRIGLGDLAGRKIAVVNMNLNAHHSEILYGPLIEAGAIPRVVPEGAPAIAFYAASERLPVPTIGWPHTAQAELADFVHVEIEPPAPVARFALLRRREPARAILDHFWNAAAAMIDARSGDPGLPRRHQAPPLRLVAG